MSQPSRWVTDGRAAALIVGQEEPGLWRQVDLLVLLDKPGRGRPKTRHYSLGWNGERFAKSPYPELIEAAHPGVLEWLTRAMK